MIRRHLLDCLREAMADTPVVFVQGPRQSGKTTLTKSFQKLAGTAHYISLDDPAVLSAAENDPQGFIQGLQLPAILDEVQHVPSLLRSIKLRVDQYRAPGQFLLTGSANPFVLPKISESLAGRMEILTLWPFSQGEWQGHRERFLDALFAERFTSVLTESRHSSDLLERLARGGYPEMLRRKAAPRRKAWFQSYITSLIQRDLRDIASIEGVYEIPRLLALIASRSACLLNFSEISRSANIPQTTLKRYWSLLEAIFLIRTLPAWSFNRSKRLTKSPKLFLTDTGLLEHLLDLNSEKLQSDRDLMGRHLETFIVTEIWKQMSWHSDPVRCFHFRSHTQEEVDLVLEHPNGTLAGLEVKSSATPRPSDFKGLHALKDSAPRQFLRGVVLYLGDKLVPFGDDLFAVPVSSLWE